MATPTIGLRAGLTQQELESRLWAAANSLRGPVDPSDFKAYIFPMLFYKRVCDAWDDEHAKATADFPDDLTPEIEADYHRFQVPAGAHWPLARVYESVQPHVDANALLWHRLGAKTAELVGTYVSDVQVDTAGLEAVAIDAGTLEALRQLELFGPGEGSGLAGPATPTVDDVLDTLEARLRRKLRGPDAHPVWPALSEHLEELRRERIAGAKDSVDFLKRLLDVARQLVGAEHAEAEGRLDTFQALDPDRGALTQILREYAPPGVPVIVEHVVEEIDALVRPIRGSRWQESQPGDRDVRRQLRLILKNSGLPPAGELYDRAYAYIREHY